MRISCCLLAAVATVLVGSAVAQMTDWEKEQFISGVSPPSDSSNCFCLPRNLLGCVWILHHSFRAVSAVVPGVAYRQAVDVAQYVLSLATSLPRLAVEVAPSVSVNLVEFARLPAATACENKLWKMAMSPSGS